MEADRICHHAVRSIASIRGARSTDVWLTIRPAFSLQVRAMFLMPRPTVTSPKRSKSLIRAQRLPVRDSPGNSTVGILISFRYIIVMLLWNPNIRHLRALAAICRLGSVSAAAQTIGLSQPAVTQGMARLELQLGRTLFESRKIGRASGRERVCQFGAISVGAVAL